MLERSQFPTDRWLEWRRTQSKQQRERIQGHTFIHRDVLLNETQALSGHYIKTLSFIYSHRNSMDMHIFYYYFTIYNNKPFVVNEHLNYYNQQCSLLFKGLGSVRFFVFLMSLLCSSRLYLFDQKYRKKTVILWNIAAISNIGFLFQHAKKYWVVSTQLWVKYGLTQLLG